MKKIKILDQIKAKLQNINYSNFLGVVILALFSATILTSFMIALPNTERYFPQYKYNLALKDRNFWRKTFIIQSSTTDDSELDLAKEIIKKRLNDYHVEAFNINYKIKNIETEPIQLEEDQTSDKVTLSELKITVQSSKDEELISKLLTDSGSLKFYTLKDNLKIFEMEPEQLNDLSNYDKAELKKEDFRTLSLKKEPNASRQDAIKPYILLFKPKLGNKKVNNFLDENAGKSYIVQIGDELHPLYYGIQLYPGVLPAESEPWFITLNLEDEQVKVYKNLISNPVLNLEEVTLIETKEEAVLLPTLPLNYILIGFITVLFITGIAIYYLTQFEKDKMFNALLFILSSGVFITGLVTYLKVSSIAYESWTIISIAVLTLIVNMVLNLKKIKLAYRIGIIVALSLIFIVVGLIAEGYYYYIARALLIAIPGIVITNLISGIYLKNLNKYILTTKK